MPRPQDSESPMYRFLEAVDNLVHSCTPNTLTEQVWINRIAALMPDIAPILLDVKRTEANGVIAAWRKRKQDAVKAWAVATDGERKDRELLSLAAAGAGYRTVCIEGGPLPGFYLTSPPGEGEPKLWDPLNDDGDALRMAVRLRFELAVFRDHSTAYNSTGWADELHKTDAAAATRRAIVRAAAQIGQPPI